MKLDQVGHYHIRAKIAEGGFGIVYIAHDPMLDRDVALKVLHPHHMVEPSRVARFLREARSAAMLQHPGIIQVYEIIETDDCMALVMEYIDGGTLEQYLIDHPELTVSERLLLAAEIAETLEAAHDTGVIHRDVKPANVLMTKTGRVKLTDFSLARLLDSALTQLTGENNVLGTPAYMSPEQCEGKKASPQSDLYSLGIMVYEMVTGSLPFDAENYLAVLRHHMDTPPTPVRLLKPTLPLELEELIMKCLSKNPENRPSSGTELAKAFRAIAAGEKIDKDTANTLELHTVRRTPTPTEMQRVQPDGQPPAVSQQRPKLRVLPREEEELVASSTSLFIEEDLDAPQRKRAGGGKSKGRRRWMGRVLVAAIVALIAAGASLFLMNRDSKENLAKTVGVPGLFSATPLLDYVKQPDDNYSFTLNSVMPGHGFTTYIIDMSSQTWHADKVSPPVWRHWLTLIVPDAVSSDKALLVLSENLSGANQPMGQPPETLANIAYTSKSVVAILEGFPRDPVGFWDEDAFANPSEFAVATFARYLDTNDPTWPVVMPIVKTVVRGMDTVQAYTSEELKLAAPINEFVLTGSSTGWGIWLTAAVDKRVAAIAPVHFDILNIGAQIEHQVGFRGAMAPFMQPFSDAGIMPALDTQAGENLLKIIDPYEYRSSLLVPKLLLLPTGDPLATIDAPKLFFDDLQGEKYLLMTPNFSLGQSNPLLRRTDMFAPPNGYPGSVKEGGASMLDTLRVFYHKVLVEKPMPQFTWNVRTDGAFEITAGDIPTEVRLWLAESPDRDFRYEKIGDAWSMTELKPYDESVYSGKVTAGREKYTAFFIELVYPSKLGINFSLTTPVTILAPEKPQELAQGNSRIQQSD